MKYVYLDASSGISGDMCLGALLDLGVDPALFKERMAGLRLPVEIAVRRVRRGGFAAVKVDVEIHGHEHIERNFGDVERIILKGRFTPGRQGPGPAHLPAAFRGRGQGPRPDVQGGAPSRGRGG